VLFAPDTGVVWLGLRRRAYLGDVAIVFSRDSALAVRQQRREFEQITGRDTSWLSAQDPVPAGSPIGAHLVAACRAPGLDFVILRAALALPHRSVATTTPYGTLYLYDCRALAPEGGVG